MNRFKFIFRMFLIGAFIFGTFTSWLAPKLLAWWFEPPVNVGINCRAATEWAMGKLQLAQTIGLFIGGILGVILSFFFKKKDQPA